MRHIECLFKNLIFDKTEHSIINVNKGLDLTLIFPFLHVLIHRSIEDKGLDLTLIFPFLHVLIHRSIEELIIIIIIIIIIIHE